MVTRAVVLEVDLVNGIHEFSSCCDDVVVRFFEMLVTGTGLQRIVESQLSVQYTEILRSSSREDAVVPAWTLDTIVERHGPSPAHTWRYDCINGLNNGTCCIHSLRKRVLVET